MTQSIDKKVNPGYRVTEERQYALKDLALKRHTSVQALIDEAVEANLFGVQYPAVAPPDGFECDAPQAVVEKLIDFWKRPQDDTMEALRNLVCSFLEIPKP